MRRRQILWAGVMGMALAAALCGVGEAGLTAGDTAPNFTLYRHGTTQPVSLYDFAGEIVVLDFFAYWCGPCQTASSELEPYIQQYYDNAGGNPAGVPVTLMSVCVSSITAPETAQYIDYYGLELALDDPNHAVFNQYKDAEGHIPQFAIINGVQSSNFDPWEVLYMRTGYGSGGYTTFRSYINQVIPGNSPPVGVADTYGLSEDGTLTVSSSTGVLANDTDTNNDPLTAIKVTNTAHGALTFYDNGALDYTPDADYNGTDTFKYKANDGTSDSNLTTVTLNIAPVNDAPVAVDDSFTIAANRMLFLYGYEGILPNDTDVDGDTLTASLESTTSHGALTFYTSGALKYTPTTGFSGQDSFTYRAYDGTAYSDLATVLINVVAIPGDATGDGRVDEADAALLASNWGQPTTGGAAAGDFNGDGTVDVADASILAANWGATVEGADLTAMPEPSGLAMVLGILLAAVCRRRTRPR